MELDSLTIENWSGLLNKMEEILKDWLSKLSFSREDLMSNDYLSEDINYSKSFILY